jgi:DNA repair protein RecO (recombination protein O)
MPGLYRDEAVVLKTIKLGEADRILTLFTRFNGKVRAVAKGVRKTKSRFGARLEPLTRVQLMLYKGRGELDTVTSADIIESYKFIRDDYSRLTAAATLAELVDKITPDRERATPTYRLLLGGLDALADGSGTSVVPAFAIKLLSLSGYHPQLSMCAGCGSTDHPSGFSPALGGVVCEDCWHEDDSALSMSPERIALLGRLLSSEFGPISDAGAIIELTGALRRYAEYHLERPLRSLELFSNP